MLTDSLPDMLGTPRAEGHADREVGEDASGRDATGKRMRRGAHFFNGLGLAFFQFSKQRLWLLCSPFRRALLGAKSAKRRSMSAATLPRLSVSPKRRFLEADRRSPSFLYEPGISSRLTLAQACRYPDLVTSRNFERVLLSLLVLFRSFSHRPPPTPPSAAMVSLVFALLAFQVRPSLSLPFCFRS